MAKVHELIEAELENIQRIVAELPDNDLLPRVSSLELAGVAALIHSFYNGIENILRQIVLSQGKEIPQTSSWHQDLIKMAISSNTISASTANKLRRYLAFRHFFSHGYSFDLDKNRIIPLVKDLLNTLASFRDDIDKALDRT